MSIILGNHHVLFELTGKLALKWGWPPHFRPKQVCLKKCSSRPCLGLEWGSFTFFTGKKMNSNQPRSKKHGVLENSWTAMISNRGYCCLSLGVKMLATGMGNWKFSLGKIIHGKKLNCGLRITASTSPVNFCCTLQLDLMMLP